MGSDVIHRMAPTPDLIQWTTDSGGESAIARNMGPPYTSGDSLRGGRSVRRNTRRHSDRLTVVAPGSIGHVHRARRLADGSLRLDEPERSAIALRYLDELSYAEIAAR